MTPFSTFFDPWITDACYAAVSLMWPIKDRRSRRLLAKG